MKPKYFLISVVFLLSVISYSQQKGYYRTPAIYQNTVVFTAEGDLWKYDMASGNTFRITTHPGVERNPLI